jgi:hypothetical protein
MLQGPLLIAAGRNGCFQRRISYLLALRDIAASQ